MFVMQPRDYQKECFEMMKDANYGGILLPMGTGKSAIASAVATHKYRNGKITALLIFSNKGSYRTWDTDQIPKHMPSDMPKHAVYWDTGTNMKRVKDFKRLYTPEKELKILIVNIEAISTKRSSAIAEIFKFLSKHRVMTVIDESSTIKNLSSARTDHAILIGEKSAYRYIMTGSSITNSPLDLWSQCLFLSPDALGFNSFFAFRGTYCTLGKEIVYQKGEEKQFIGVTGFKRLNDLRESLDTFCYIKTKDQCLDLPDKIYQKFYVEMSADQKKFYNEFKKEAIAMINDSKVTATVVLAQLTKLRQIACGFVKTDDGQIHLINDSRIDELIKLLEETNEKTIIWSSFVPSIKMIEERIKKEFGTNSVVSYYGETTGEQRPERVKKFMEDSECKYFVGNPAVGGWGLNLTNAAYMIYYNNDYSYDKRGQSEDRFHRIGQMKNVTIVDMLAKGTIDPHILNVLEGKKDIAAMVLGDKKSALSLLQDSEEFI